MPLARPKKDFVTTYGTVQIMPVSPLLNRSCCSARGRAADLMLPERDLVRRCIKDRSADAASCRDPFCRPGKNGKQRGRRQPVRLFRRTSGQQHAPAMYFQNDTGRVSQDVAGQRRMHQNAIG